MRTKCSPQTYYSKNMQSPELRPGYGFAITSLTLGILSLLILGFVFSIIGIVFGVLSLKTQGCSVGIVGLVICIIMTIIRVGQTLLIHLA